MTPAQIAKARQLRASLSDAAIGARFGVSRQRIHKILGPRAARLARPTPPPPAALPPPPTRAELAAMLKAWRAQHGLSQRAAAAVLRIDPLTLANWEQERTGCSLAALVSLSLDFLPIKR